MTKPNFPFFFGSTVVLACVIGMMGSMGGMLFSSLGVLIKPLSAEFGWGRGDISIGLTYLTIGIVVGILASSHLIDKFGSRRVLIVAISLSILVVMVGPLYVSNLTLFHGMLFLGAIVGAPTSTVAYARVISDWFDRRRGFFIGVNASGMGLGFAVVPLITEQAVSYGGWQAGYYCMGAVMLIIVLPVLYVWLIDQPQAVGLHPDGEEREYGANAGSYEEDDSLSLIEAIRTPTFWLLVVIVSSVAFALYGTLTQLVPMLTDRGVDTSTAAMVASTMGISMAVARIIVGFLLDYIFAPRLALIVFSLAMLGIVLILFSDSLSLYFLAAIFLGFGIGAEGDLVAYLASRYYGMRHYAVIFGCLFSAYMLGTGLGPYVLGRSFDLHGDYTQILQVCIVIMLIAIVLTNFLVPYNRYRTKHSGE